MKVLIALPIIHPEFNCIDDVIDGRAASSGTTGSIIRLVNLLTSAGLDVSLSAASEVQSNKFHCLLHKFVDAKQFDYLIVHQSHWNGSTFTFGEPALIKTFLWFQNQTSWAFVDSFIKRGGYKVIVPSIYHANLYRAIPQWREKVAVIYNSYCSIFTPTSDQPQSKLLFIGAITPTKGFIELMQVWSYLTQKQVELKLAIAGTIGIHKSLSSVQLGSLGIAESDFETNQLIPWLQSLPESYQPHFLGALSPLELRREISQSWAVIVNPSWNSLETFCVSAVEAQACERIVFSVAAGGLQETVYCGDFNSLTKQRGVEAVGNSIIDGLSQGEIVEKNGYLAREFITSKFSNQVIIDNWIRVLSGDKTEPSLPQNLGCIRDLICDLMRVSKTGMLFEQYLLKRS